MKSGRGALDISILFRASGGDILDGVTDSKLMFLTHIRIQSHQRKVGEDLGNVCSLFTQCRLARYFEANIGTERRVNPSVLCPCV